MTTNGINKNLIWLGLLLAWASRPGLADTVLFCPFDTLEGWTLRAVGDADAAVVEPSETIRCAELTSTGGTVFLSREIPLDAVRGCRVTVWE